MKLLIPIFIGSVTQRVISEAPCPVLAIHEDIVD
ncbi:universal stress protein [Acetobacterium tundrae]|uniref:UspA domain-containing protein n=1 Tax=Acetobacterium tundrae TaxID=132932 RepID=A0ABR6WNG2_9FIRM|nr:universal stress protein [Acetobacterium tundrae]MBC3797947.1 hypothetical protein [Acetobacterium tundrae]